MIGQCNKCGEEPVELHIDAAGVAICNVCMKDSHGPITHPLYEIFKHAHGNARDRQGNTIKRQEMLSMLDRIGSDGNPDDFGSR